MPTERFLNLPEEKQKRIIQASLREFSRVPFEEVSINRIIQDAGIARGSFYQYFEDKQDLRMYLLGGFRICLEKKIEIYLNQKKGDLFQFFKDALDEIVKEGMQEELKDVCKNVFSQMRYGGDCMKDIVITTEDGKQWREKVLLQMKENYYPEYSLEELVLVGEMLIQQIKESIANIFLYEEYAEEIKENYYKKIDLIEAGMKAVKESKHV
ncbi:MAG: TetR family transcriptional regulator [Lachnospiraceae bacterium]|nr:TetR family transcriptional regulator [Lachnospiraceae bacterium]